MELGGVTGKITYEGFINPFLQILKVGAAIHIGKGTSFGFGNFQYNIIE